MQVSTSMRHAFTNAKVRLTKGTTQKPTTGAAIMNQCMTALERGAGLMNWGKGWNAHLSFKTAKLLGMPDCTNPRAHMPYDKMVQG